MTNKKESTSNPDLLTESRIVLPLDEMNRICTDTNNFDYVDEKIYNTTTRTFCYRLNIPKSFNQIGARNFRGATYDLQTGELLALPFFKFFNYNETTFSSDQYVRSWTIDKIYEKVDGSMVYFYEVNNQLVCRTQRRCSNLQSNEAMRIVQGDKKLYDFIKHTIGDGYTPIFELISPKMDPHICQYPFDGLCLLALRSRVDGTIKMNDNDSLYTNPNLRIYPTKEESQITSIYDLIDLCMNDRIPIRSDLREGYVVTFTNGEMVKFKRIQFVNLERMSLSIRNEKFIVKTLFDGLVDNLLSELPSDEPYISNIISCVDDTWNHDLKISKDFYLQYKDMGRKDFVRSANALLDEDQFNIVMLYYKTGNTEDVDLSRLQDAYIKSKGWRRSKLYKA